MSHETTNTTPQPQSVELTDEVAAQYHQYRSVLEKGLSMEQKLVDVKQIPGFRRTASHLTTEMTASRDIQKMKEQIKGHDFSSELERIEKLWHELGGVAFDAARSSTNAEPAVDSTPTPSNTQSAEVSQSADKKRKVTPRDVAERGSATPEATSAETVGPSVPSSQDDYDNGELHRISGKIDLSDQLPDGFVAPTVYGAERADERAQEWKEVTDSAADALNEFLDGFEINDDASESAADAIESLSTSIENDPDDNDVRPLGVLGLKAVRFLEIGKSSMSFLARERADIAKQAKADRLAIKNKLSAGNEAAKAVVAGRGGEKAAYYLTDKKLFRGIGLRFGTWLGNEKSGFELSKKKLAKRAEKQRKMKR